MAERSSAFSDKRLPTWFRHASVLVFLLLTWSGASSTTLSSPNPKTNSAYTIDDVVMLDLKLLNNIKEKYFTTLNPKYGIKGTVPAGGKITVKMWPYDPSKADGKLDLCIFEVSLSSTSLTSYGKETKTVKPSSLLKGENQYTNVASDDIFRLISRKGIGVRNSCLSGLWSFNLFVRKLRTDVRALLYDVPRGDKEITSDYNECMKFIAPHLPVIVEVEYSGTGVNFVEAKIPGISAVTPRTENNVTIVDAPRPNLANFCTGNNSDYCDIFRDIRNPPDPTATGFKENIYVACHRGKWGQPLSGGNAENTIAAVQDAEAITGYNSKLIEMDLTEIADGTLVFLHDYVMSRLTSYTGSLYSFQMTWPKMLDYYVRLRDGSQSTSKVTLYHNLALHMRDNNHFLMLDIKEKQAKMRGTTCVANCDFQTALSQDASWATITRNAIIKGSLVEATKNITIKTYKFPQVIEKLLGPRIAKFVFWTPMIVSNAPQWKTNGQPDIQKMCDFVDEWHSKLGDVVLCFETDFFTPSDVQLQSFSRTKNGVTTTYQNLPHYIYATTGRRSGIFSEDPASSKGTVNRWGDWKMKDTSTDLRGDFLWLSQIPYGKIFLVTTDRPDVWNSLKTELQK